MKFEIQLWTAINRMQHIKFINLPCPHCGQCFTVIIGHSAFRNNWCKMKAQSFFILHQLFLNADCPLIIVKHCPNLSITGSSQQISTISHSKSPLQWACECTWHKFRNEQHEVLHKLFSVLDIKSVSVRVPDYSSPVLLPAVEILPTGAASPNAKEEPTSRALEIGLPRLAVTGNFTVGFGWVCLHEPVQANMWQQYM